MPRQPPLSLRAMFAFEKATVVVATKDRGPGVGGACRRRTAHDALGKGVIMTPQKSMRLHAMGH
jgi:hypothetical protein